MDISNRQSKGKKAAQTHPSFENERQTEGEALVETVITLTGLPEPLVSKELGQILEMSGHSSQELTLDQLREAMLLYLERIQEEASKTQNELF